MSAVEEHKPVEKRRALGRGLDSLLPSGPRIVTAPPAVPPAVVIPPATPGVAPTSTKAEAGAHAAAPLDSGATSAEVAEIHAVRDSHFSQKQREVGHSIDGANSGTAESRAGAPAPHLTAAPDGQEISEIPLELIDENPYQTRRTFDESALKELAESIKANGLAQPIVVRPGTNANGRYVLVLGERRCRASKLAGKTTVAAIVRQLGNEQAAEMTIVENLQRQDLNCLEQAQAFARLSREFNLTQEQIGQRVGTSRESVANYMRLLKLPPVVLGFLAEGKLGFSEARVLLEALPHTDARSIELLARSAVDGGLTVRHLKLQVEGLIHPELHKPEPRQEKPVDPNVRDAERQLREALGMRVRVMAYQGNKGQVVIRYESLADFDRIFERLSRDN